MSAPDLLDAADLTQRLHLECSALSMLLGVAPEEALCSTEIAQGVSLLLDRLSTDLGQVASALSHLARCTAA